MAQINKVNVSGTSYDISQSPDATFTATSSDAASPTSWTDVAVLASGETNSSIFGKISSMFKNIRFLYSKLGTTDFSAAGSTVSAALAALQSGKAASDHTHSTATTAAAGFLRALNGSTANYLRGDGNWATPPNTTYAVATTATNGLASTWIVGQVNQIDGLITANTDTTNRIKSFDTSTVWWSDSKLGLSVYYYEGKDTTTYAIPTPHCVVIRFVYSTHRGVAIAIDWRSTTYGHMYLNRCHNDTATLSWSGWVARGLRYSYSSGTLNLYDN